MPNPLLLYAATVVTLVAILAEVLNRWGIVTGDAFLAPVLFGLAVVLWLMGVGLMHPIALVSIFAVVTLLLLGINYQNWFGLRGILSVAVWE